MSIQLTDEQLDAITRHGEGAYPYEGCGLLLGHEVDGVKIVEQVLPAGNARESEAQHNRYLIAPETVMQAERRAAEQGLDLVGFFHSHPDHPERPSDYDREHAWPWYSYLITSVQRGHAAETAAWTLEEGRGVFRAEAITIEQERAKEVGHG